MPGAPGPRGKATRGEELTQEARSDLAVMLWGKVAKSGSSWRCSGSTWRGAAAPLSVLRFRRLVAQKMREG